MKGSSGDANLPFDSPWEDIMDPGTGNRIRSPGRSGCCSLVTGAAAETRLVGDPDFVGQVLLLYFATDGGGNCVVTFDHGVSSEDFTTLTLTIAGQHLFLFGMRIGSNMRWRTRVGAPSVNLLS